MRAPASFIRKCREEVSACGLQQLLDRCITHLAQSASPVLIREDLEDLVSVTKRLSDILLTNSSNSSLPPSADPHRDKKPKDPSPSGRRPGAQPGHPGRHLGQTTPTETVTLQVDRSKIPPDRILTPEPPILRQVYDIRISRVVVEYQAEVLVDQYGNRYTADFPPHVKAYSQYDSGMKAYVTDLSVQQMIPYERLSELMNGTFDIPVSTGSIRNFINEAAKRLKLFEIWIKTILISIAVLYTDMTSINVSGKQKYVSIYCDEEHTYLVPHEKKGDESILEVGIIPKLKSDQILMHDCDPTYFKYDCKHAACGAHLLRDLKGVEDKDGLRWPIHMKNLLADARKERELPEDERNTLTYYRKRFRSILTRGEKETEEWKNKHKLSNGKELKDRLASEVLLKRLRKYEDAYLRFIEDQRVDFTNNISERGLRPIKIRNKISGCVKSMPSAEDICLIMSYLSTCKKHNINADEALNILFKGSLPDFIDLSIVDARIFEEEKEAISEEN